jgi:hypothetical protein
MTKRSDVDRTGKTAALWALEIEFREVARGHEAYLYTERPANTTWYVFTDGKRIPDIGKAEAHLRGLIARVRAGERLWW